MGFGCHLLYDANLPSKRLASKNRSTLSPATTVYARCGPIEKPLFGKLERISTPTT